MIAAITAKLLQRIAPARRVATGLSVLACCSVALAGESATVQVDIDGAEHVDALGSLSNTVLQVPLPAGAVIQGVGWSGRLTTIGESWASDAIIAFSDGQQPPALSVVPGDGDFAPTPAGGTQYSSGGVVSLGSMGQPGVPISGGVVFIEFAEEFVDEPGEVEAFWTGPATITIQYDVVFVGDCPGDLNTDGVVNVSDLLAVLSAWGPCPKGGACAADLNDDQTVDVADLLALLSAWGDCPPGGDLQGACCLSDGSCLDLTAAQCAAQSGTYQGDYTKCETWQCSQPPDGSSCDQAIPVQVNGPAISGDTTGTTVPADLQACSSAGTPPSNTGMLWFSVEGDGTTLTARTCESDIPTTIAVYCAQTCQPEFINCIEGSSEGDCDDPFQATVSWCSAEGRQYLIGVWSWEESYGEVAVSVESGAGCTGAAECLLPCDGHCGSMSPSGCWCDDFLCSLFGDCCPGLCESCPEQPSCESVCSSAACPPGATPEGEPCGGDINGGCNTDPSQPPLGDLSCGETVCGTLWAANGLRDTDWYRLDLTSQSGPVDVTISVQADLDVNVVLLQGDCPPEAIADVSGCDVSLSRCLQPGEYMVVVVPSETVGFPCAQGPHQYNLSASCAASCEDSCVGWCGEEAPTGCWCDDECYLFSDCCPDVCIACPDTDGC